MEKCSYIVAPSTWASGYLQNKDCSADPTNKVWVGIDATGKAICGHRITPLAGIGRFSEIAGTVQVMKNGTSTWTAANTTDLLAPGDIIKTENNGTGTIQFIADASLLRLDVSTTVELRTGELSGQSVAQAILSDGRLWGRILTSTGVNLGGGGMVAGVRGTSVSVAKVGSEYTLTVVDSRDPSRAAILSTDINEYASYSGDILTAPAQIIYGGSTTSSTSTSEGGDLHYVTTLTAPSLTSVTKSLSYSSSPWIRDNIRADIDYLYANSGSSIVRTELIATQPSSTDILALNYLCADNGIDPMTYWTSLIGTTHETCRDHNLIAFADYTGGGPDNDDTNAATPLYLSGISLSANSV